MLRIYPATEKKKMQDAKTLREAFKCNIFRIQPALLSTSVSTLWQHRDAKLQQIIRDRCFLYNTPTAGQ